MFGRRRGGSKYNFTDRFRVVLALAREEANRLRHDSVGPEHMLLGLMRENEGVAAAVLRRLGVAPEEVRDAVEGVIRPGTATGTLAELPYTSDAKRVMELSMAEAREMDHAYIGTEHLLVALFREERSRAGAALRRLGPTLAEVRREVRARLAEGSSADEADPEPTGFTVEIDDASSRSIYEQIVERVREAVATGGLAPGERLPPVRRLADRLDIAPGTVARAYAQLERDGVVVTEGARGTRVAPRVETPATEAGRAETLAGLLRASAVAAFHLGATADDLRAALEEAMRGIFDGGEKGEAA